MSNNSINYSSSIDDFSPGKGPGFAKFRKASLDPRPDSIEAAKSASIAEESESYVEPAEIADELEGDRDFEFDREFRGVDEFTTPDPFKDKNREKNDEKDRRRRERRLGKVKRANPFLDGDHEEEEVFDFLSFLDNLWRRLYDFVEEIVDEFDNWNKWFKKEKKKPPEPDNSKVLYIRDEFNNKRSPHLWKSDPNRKWILTYGNNKVNNVVSSILYKYQNETISKDA